MPKGKRRKICLETGKKPTFPRKHKNWEKENDLDKLPKISEIFNIKK